MKKFALIIMVVALLAAGCQKAELQKDYPSSPSDSYNQVPR